MHSIGQQGEPKKKREPTDIGEELRKRREMKERELSLKERELDIREEVEVARQKATADAAERTKLINFMMENSKK